MKLISCVVTLLPVTTAVSSCADLEGKDVYLRAPWYGQNFTTKGGWMFERHRFAYGTETMQVRQDMEVTTQTQTACPTQQTH